MGDETEQYHPKPHTFVIYLNHNCLHFGHGLSESDFSSKPDYAAIPVIARKYPAFFARNG